MDILIKKALIYDDSKKLHGERKNILISKGIIKSISNNIASKDSKIIESDNLHCSIGWMDIGTHLGEPGYEFRETTNSLCEAATFGGYTAIAPFPSTQPIIQSASDIRYLKDLFSDKIQEIYPIAAISQNLKGEDLTEMKDLIFHGAIAFGDGLHGIQSGGLLLRALQYTSDEMVPIIDHPVDLSLIDGGQMHEGDVSITMGLKGIPSISEGVQVSRNIALSRYANARLIFHAVSSKKSLQFIQQETKKGTDLKVTVSYMNLVSEHSDLEGFNVNYKVIPPIRSKSDQNALIEGIKKGRIDSIISNHLPLEVEQKMLEFPYATPGAIGLETCFAALSSKYRSSELENIIHALSIGPRRILNIPTPAIRTGVKANLTLFDPDIEWTYDSQKSISSNSPFLGKKFKGKVVGIINGTLHSPWT